MVLLSRAEHNWTSSFHTRGRQTFWPKWGSKSDWWARSVLFGCRMPFENSSRISGIKRNYTWLSGITSVFTMLCTSVWRARVESPSARPFWYKNVCKRDMTSSFWLYTLAIPCYCWCQMCSTDKGSPAGGMEGQQATITFGLEMEGCQQTSVCPFGRRGGWQVSSTSLC